MVSGIWLSWTLRGVLVMLMIFILAVAQAIIRKLPLGECGCFGQLVSFPLHVVILMDSGLLLVTTYLLSNLPKTRVFSLDKYFEK